MSDPFVKNPTILFRSDTLAVRAHLGRGSDAVCVVVFDPLVDRPSLDRVAFGEHYFDGLGIDAIHVLSARNDWYQDADLPTALAAARAWTRRYQRVVTYGSSMGGYAALRFSGQVGAHAVIAISPQYSLTQGLPEPDLRWKALGSTVAWRHEAAGGGLPPVAEALVIYDPHDPDRRHADAVARDLPRLRRLPVPYAGHPAGDMVAQTGQLSALVLAMAQGTLDVGHFAGVVRDRRRSSGAYLFTLARRQPASRLRLKQRLIALALAAAPEAPAYLSYAALVRDSLGEPAAALSLHDAAVKRSEVTIWHARRALALLRAGRVTDASEAARRAIVGSPPHDQTSNENRVLAALRDDPAEAFRTILNSPWLAGPPWPLRWVRHLREVPPLRRLVGRLAGGAIALVLLRRIARSSEFRRHELFIGDRF